MTHAEATPTAVTPRLLEVLEQLSGVASGFASVHDLPGLARQIEDAIESILHVEYNGLYLWDFDESRLRLLVAVGFSEDERAEAERTAWERHPGRIFRERHELHVPDTEADPAMRTQTSKRRFAVRSRLFMPVTFRDQVLGVFGLASKNPHHFHDEHIAVLRFICRLTGVIYRQLLDRQERERAQAALASTARRLQLLVGTLPIALLALDPGGRIILAEGAGLRDLSDAPLLGRPFAEALAGDPALCAHLARAAAGEALTAHHRVGDQYLEIRCAPNLAEHGGGATVMVHNITAHQRSLDDLARLNAELVRARDQALSATQVKSRFLATMSHELRTPLNAILGYAEMVREDLEGAGDPLAADVARIEDAATQLLGLINDILDISKIEAGKMTLALEPIDLAPLLHSVEVALRPLRERGQNRMTVAVDPAIGPIHADATALRRVLINLLSNANKFTQRGDIALRVWEADVDGQRRLYLEVEDTGIGMSPEQLARIFDAFTQADASTTRRFGGTGLGLTITEQLLHLMGGAIAVASELGRGSRFTAWIPAIVRPPT